MATADGTQVAEIGLLILTDDENSQDWTEFGRRLNASIVLLSNRAADDEVVPSPEGIKVHRLLFDRWTELLGEWLDHFGARLCLVSLTTALDSKPIAEEVVQRSGRILAVAEVLPSLATELGARRLRLPVQKNLQRLLNLEFDSAADLDHIGEIVPEVCELLEQYSGTSFRDYRPGLLHRRIAARMASRTLQRADDYLLLLREDGKEREHLEADLLIGVTRFFRDSDAFCALYQAGILPLLRSTPADQEIRAWVAGCSTGEEAYSVAMLFEEAMAEMQETREVKIFATDIDAEALLSARQGLFPRTAMEDVSPQRRKQFFVEESDGFRVTPKLRRLIQFSRQNLTTDPPLIEIDLICCRNLLIYLTSPLQEKIIPVFHHSLRSGGLLFLGTAETITKQHTLFNFIDEDSRLFRRVEGNVSPDWMLGKASSPLFATSGGRDELDLGPVVERILRQEFTPRCLVVNDEGRLIWSSGKIEDFLQLGPGPFNNQMVQLAKRGLKSPLRSALQEARKKRETVRREKVQFRSDTGKRSLLDITVQPLPNLGSLSALYLVVFQDLPYSLLDGSIEPGSEHTYKRLAELDQELNQTREELEVTVHELETANEDLKSSVEELRAMNEELRVTNIELKRSRAEVEQKNGLLGRAYSDLEHLLISTDLPSIFVDLEQRILRFTPPARRVYNLLDSDIGRPLWHVTHLARSMPPLEPVPDGERSAEVQMLDGGWMVRKDLPYRDSDGAIQGTVFTFNDVSAQRRSQALLDQSLREMEVIYNSAPVGMAVLDLQYRVLRINRILANLLGREQVECVGLSLRDLLDASSFANFEPALTAVASGQQPVFEKEFRLQPKGQKSPRLCQGSFHPLQDAQGSCVGLNVVIQDVSLAGQEGLSKDRLLALLDESEDFVLVADAKGRCLYLNRSARKLSGLAETVRSTAHFQDFFFPEDRKMVHGLLAAATAENRRQQARMRLRHVVDGRELFYWAQIMPIKIDQDHTGLAFVGRGLEEWSLLSREQETLLRRQSAAFDKVGLGVVLFDNEDRYTYVNQAGLDILEVGLERLLGKTLEEAYPEVKGSAVEDIYNGAKAGAAQELLNYSKTRHRWLLTQAFSTPYGVAMFFRDVTKKKANEERLDQMASIVATTSDVVATYDAGGTLTYLNQAGFRLLGQPFTEDLNRLKELELFDLEGTSPKLDLVSLARDKRPVEAWLRRHDGERIPFSLVAVRHLDPQSQVHSYSVTARDIGALQAVTNRLRESEQRFRRAILNAPIPVLIFNDEGKMLALSDTLLNATGYHLEDFPALRQWLLISHRDKGDQILAAIQKGMEGDVALDLEAEVYTRKGEKRIWQFTLAPPYQGENGRRLFVMMATDVTDRYERSRLLEERSLFLRRVLDSLYSFVGVCDPAGVVLEVNQAALRMTGVAPEAVLGKPFSETLWWAQDHAAQERLRAAIAAAAEGQLSRYDTQVRGADGGLMTIDFQLAPMVDSENQLTHLIPSALDVTEQRELERQLRATKDMFKAILDSTAEGIYGMDVEGRCIFANRTCAVLLGYEDAEELLGRTLHLTAHEHAEGENCPVCYGCSSLSSVHITDETFMRRDGSRFPVEYWCYPVAGENAIIGSVITFFDTSERKHGELQLLEARASAEAASQAKSDFLANMSHEIRTPMTAILGYAEILLGHLQNPDDVACVQVIQRNGHHLLEIINEILDLSKIEAGKLVLEKSPLRIGDLISEVIRLLDVRANEKSLELSVEFETALPQEFLSDGGRLRQILVNLIGNAIKFTEKGQVSLRVRMLREPELLAFEIRDTGIGISEAQMEQLFRPFMQADASVTRKYGGTGLGLAITKQLVEMLGGSIQAESQVGVGSTFQFTIATGPVEDAVWIDTQALAPLHAQRAPDEGSREILAGYSILVTDDRRDIRHLVSSYLEEAGAYIQTAENGEKALQHLEQHEVDLLILDMQMPVLDGYATAKRLRSSHFKAPIVALTASAMKGDREQCLAAGCNDYLSKPVVRTQLIERVALLVGNRELQSKSEVLVVEDNPMAAALMKALLQAMGCTVYVSGDGQSCIDQMEKSSCDLVLLDLQLPDIDGYEVLDRLRARSEFDHCWIVAHTGRSPDEVGTSPGRNRFDEILQKPASRDVLGKLVRRVRGRIRPS